MRHLRLHFILLLPLLLLAPGCENNPDGDKPKDPAPISGSSNLRINNQSDDTANIFFDGVYIGDISPGTSRTWSVPEGTHTIRLTNSIRNNVIPLSETYNFPAGSTVTLSLTFKPPGTI